MQDAESHWDVIVVGAGPSGLTTANLLAQSGVRTLVVERNAGTVDQPRAVSIDDESLRTMQAAGIVDEVVRDVALDYGSHFFGRDRKLIYKVEPATREYGYPRRNAVVQPSLEATLHRCLERRDNAACWFGWACGSVDQEQGGVVVHLEGPDGATKSLSASFVVGADGARSRLRELIGSNLEGETYAQRWLIVDIEGTGDRSRQSMAIADPERPLVNLPGPDGRRRFEFMLHPHEDSDAVVDEGFVRDLVSRYGPDRNANIVRRQVYTFHARVADKWQEGRVFLVGDAAHLSPPFAGQGMNSGVRDAHNIAWKLAWVVHKRLGPALLDTYQAEREPHARALIAMAVKNGVLLMPRSRLSAWMRRTALRVVNQLPSVANYHRNMRNKPKGAYTRGFVAPDSRSARVGRMFAQPRLELMDRSRVMMDDLIGDRFAIVIIGRNAQEVAWAAAREDWGSLDPAIIAVTPWDCNIRRDLPDVIAGRDVDHILGDFKTDRSGLVLLRPDRYVALDEMVADDLPHHAATVRRLAASVRD